MKTMTEIVESIKNEKLKEVARDLQAKLENAKNAIVQKRNSGEKVTRTESSALKTSALGYVKKGLSLALVTAMLTTMLASCDELIGPGVDTGTSEEQTTEEYYEVYENGLHPKFELGGPFKEMNFIKMLSDGHEKKSLEKEMEAFHKRMDKGQAFKDAEKSKKDALVASIENILNQEYDRCAVFKLSHPPMDENEYKYDHAIIVADKEMYLLTSDNEEEGYYVTGFVDGKFRDDLDMLDANLEGYVDAYLANGVNYDMAVQNAKASFFHILLTETINKNSRYYSGDIDCGVNWSFDRATKELEAEMSSVKIYGKDGKLLYKTSVKTDVDVHFLDKYTNWALMNDFESEVPAEESTSMEEGNNTTEETISEDSETLPPAEETEVGE